MKIALTISITLLVCMFLIHEMHLNNAFTPVLKIRSDQAKVYEVAPGDTLKVDILVSNHSYQSINILDSKKSCGILHAEIPRSIRPKHFDHIFLYIKPPITPGDYNDTIVMRTNTEDIFESATVNYRVVSNMHSQL